MATSTSRAVEQQAAQRALVAAMLADMARAWPLLNESMLRRSLPQWITAVLAIVTRYGRMSGGLAVDYYEAERDAAGLPGRFTVPFPELPPQRQVDQSLRWATKDLWTRLDGETSPSGLVVPSKAERLSVAKLEADAVAAKLVADVGRGAVTGAVTEDRQATGWARTAAIGACAFCRMLATRGPAYDEQTVKFRAHDGCHCMAQPVFRGQRWEPLPHVREWQDQYERASKQRGDTLNNFRRIVEGRA